MRIELLDRHPTRRGHTIVLVALLLPVLFGILGLSIDAGVLAVSRAQLETESDAAALAGASKLNDPARLNPSFSFTYDISAARAQALAIGRANSVLGQKATLNDNTTNDPAGDVVVGYLNLAVPGSTLQTGSTYTSLFNSVQVKAQRSGDHGGAVPAYFSKALGFGDTSVTVQSTATVQNYAISGFKCSPSGRSTKMVPITLSLTTYNAMLAGLTTDLYTYQASTAQVVSGADGLYESSIYPVGSGAGNWGTLQVGVNNNGTSTLASQIQNGLSTDDISTSFGCSMTLNSTIQAPNPTIQASGNPGVSLGLRPALQSLVGKTVILPVYDPTRITGNGSNLQYTIVNFAAVAVLNTTFNGVHSDVTVQPALTTDSTAILGAAQTSWAAGGIVRLHLSR